MQQNSEPPKSYKRKLSAILSADVKGYSRLMEEDEDATVHTLNVYRKVIETVTNQHRGRVVDSPGDNILAEFSSVVDALRCAWEIQREIKSSNADLPENRRMNFRIGVNLGDVIEEEERIYGSGVNIAARLESLAEEGGICISGTVYDHIKNKLQLKFDYLGEQIVKNIKDPVRVYRVLMESQTAGLTVLKRRAGLSHWRRMTLVIATLLVTGMGILMIKHWWFPLFSPPQVEKRFQSKNIFPLPDKPSIAVLPFTNLSNDPEQEYFSDGITNDIITDLSRFRDLFVIASNTAFTYKGKPESIKAVSQELGVRYVLEGSLQKLENKVRVNVQLIDASTGHHLWAERYERELKDLFDVQNEIVKKIVARLAVKIAAEEGSRAMRKNTDNLNAYDYVLRGRRYLTSRTRSDSEQARKMFKKAIELDPLYASAYVGLGRVYLLNAMYGWTEFRDQALDEAQALARKALGLEETAPSAHALLGAVYAFRGLHDLAIRELDRAIELNPNDAHSYSTLGWVMVWSGKPDEAIPVLKMAIILDPNIQANPFAQLGFAYYLTGKYEEAVSILERGVIRHPDFLGLHIALAATYAQAGLLKEAARSAQNVLRLHPFFKVETYGTAYRNPPDRDKILEGLRKAGLK